MFFNIYMSTASQLQILESEGSSKQGDSDGRSWEAFPGGDISILLQVVIAI